LAEGPPQEPPASSFPAAGKARHAETRVSETEEENVALQFTSRHCEYHELF
jgi:hypothetical protein